IGYYLNISIDGIIGIIVSLLIIYTGYEIAKEVVSILLGTSPTPELVEKINTIIMKNETIVGLHDLNVHDYGPGRSVASVHVEVLDYLNLVEAHTIIDKIEKKILNELGIDIVIHVDPISESNNTDY
ncbi:MAG: Cation diffusion facilitator family transporter, partial [Haloplasmataceae bacterium]|nr:Cation diffusion facilitator family transporter [Haloplasmataceae bacterium]